MSGPQRMRRGAAPMPANFAASAAPVMFTISDQTQPARRVPKWRKPLPIPRHAHPFVRRIYLEMNTQKVTMLEVADISGLRRQTIWDWGNRHPPRVDQMEAALNALGLRMRIEAIPDDEA